MESALLFCLSSDKSDFDEKIERRRLRDKSNPLSLSKNAFIKRFRLKKDAFRHVLSILRFECQLSTAVPPVLQLVATLLLLGSGGFQNCIGNDYLIGMCQSSVSKIRENVLKEMELKLCPRYIVFDPQDSANCKKGFMTKYKIPGVIGCIDGTPFGFRKPSNNEHMFFNRKGFHSLNAMIICDHEYRINAIDSKYGGVAHDSFVWKYSTQRNLLEDQFRNNENGNAWLLEDSGYPLEPWCITPYRKPQDGSDECVFNQMHSKARAIVERTIGVLKERWKIV